jgi:hypothetical protein
MLEGPGIDGGDSLPASLRALDRAPRTSGSREPGCPRGEEQPCSDHEESDGSGDTLTCLDIGHPRFPPFYSQDGNPSTIGALSNASSQAALLHTNM